MGLVSLALEGLVSLALKGLVSLEQSDLMSLALKGLVSLAQCDLIPLKQMRSGSVALEHFVLVSQEQGNLRCLQVLGELKIDLAYHLVTEHVLLTVVSGLEEKP